MSTLPVPGQPRLFSSNKNSVRLSEQNCFVVRATREGWSNPVYMQSTECWTCYVMKATVFTEYDAALSAVLELRGRPPQSPTAREIIDEKTKLDVVPLMGQFRRDKDNGLRKK